MKRAFKNLILFIIFGVIYFALECIWKGEASHWTMYVLGGLVGVLIGGINETLNWDMPLWQQSLIGMSIATICEAAGGLLLNVYLHLNIWHYNVLAFFQGQCSVPFCLIWLALSLVCILLDDFLRWKLFGEEKPHYKWR